ncbi:PH domain-containing protein [Planctomycetes bacterium K23_9]|uniref:Bacterial membrane flanked domain protein n=1 Tax=Stieleria marina TaxID=1930275 RepID=A0A517NRW3_9BACT|nr:Bacterial membrane flanked domain protein [Planctomycetes bacterium K23_9]
MPVKEMPESPSPVLSATDNSGFNPTNQRTMSATDSDHGLTIDEDHQTVREEKTVYVASPSMFRNHPIAFVLTCVLCLVGVGLPFMLAWWIRSKSTELTVTDLRTRLHRGWLSRSITEVWHRDVRNVQLHQSFIQRIFDVGRIGVSSAGQDGIEIDVSGLRNPDQIKGIIDEHRAIAKDA